MMKKPPMKQRIVPMPKTVKMSRMQRPQGKRRQSGIAMLEVLGALAIGAALLLSLSTVMDSSLEDMKGQQAAYYQSQLSLAANKYIAANSSTLQTALPTAASLAPVTVAQLIAGHFLPAATGAKNVFGQTPCLLVRQPDPVSRPGQFDALLVTTGGDPIPDRTIATVAVNAGAGGGYISVADAGNAKGASWNTSTASFRSASCSGGSALTGTSTDGGRLASNLFYNGPGQLSTDFLYRNAVPGRPELNRMNTPIRMASAALVSMGDSCLNPSGVAEAGVAIDTSTRSILTCGSGGTWSYPSQWKEPVSTYGSLPTAGSQTGDVRMVTGLSRAFTFNGSSWVALAVDQNGNLNVPGTLTAANAHVTQNIVADGTIHAAGDITTSGSVSADVDVNAARAVNTKDAYVAHNVVTQGMEVDRWASSPAITIGINFFSPGQACHYLEYDPFEGTTHIVYPIGTIVMDASYRPLICGPDKTMRYANGTYTP